jgi:hypothetical protein
MKIVAAAIKCPDGRILTGPTHSCIAGENDGIKGKSAGYITGFVDDDNNFYNRKEAGALIGKRNAIHQDIGKDLGSQ